MTPHRLAAACALLLLGSGVAPATAADDTSVITVRGARSAYVDVSFPARFRLRTDSFGKNGPRITGTGTYAGVYVTRAGAGSGAVLLRGLPAWRDFALPLGTDGWLAAGTYRVHLLADAPATVRIVAEGVRRDLSLTPDKRSDVTAKSVRRRTNGVDAPVDRTVLPVTVRPTTLTLLASSQESDGVGGDQRICLHPPGGQPLPCEVGGGNGGGLTAFGSPGRIGVGTALLFYPGDVPAGENEAEFVDVSGGAPAGMYAFALTVS